MLARTVLPVIAVGWPVQTCQKFGPLVTDPTARAPLRPHRTEQPGAIAASARPCDPLAQHWASMACGRIGPRVSACAGGADGAGCPGHTCLRASTRSARRITERRAIGTAVI